jgi:hypothetical protein
MSSSDSFNDRTGNDGFFNPIIDNRPLLGANEYNLDNLDELTFDDNFGETERATDDS